MRSILVRRGATVAGALVILVASTSATNAGLSAEPPSAAFPTFTASSPALAAAQPMVAAPSPSPTPEAGATLDCAACHGQIVNLWAMGPHAGKQSNAFLPTSPESWQSPDEIAESQDLDDCLACHLATSALVSRGMSQAQALASFYTSMSPYFELDTTAPHTRLWPQVSCTTCHQVPSDHPTSKSSLVYAGVTGGKTQPASNSSELCLECHNNPLINETDRESYDALLANERSQNQVAIAGELIADEAGKTAEDVIGGEDADDCIACHAPTSVLTHGGMTEVQAIGYFFTTDSQGEFTSSTTAAHSSEWQSLACTSCHDPHQASSPAYFDPASKSYQTMADSDQLCGQCHGDLNVSNSSYLSYNIMTGTGGDDIPDMQTMPGATCISCHMAAGTGGTTALDVNHGHSWAISVKNANGTITTTCTKCHNTMDAYSAEVTIEQWQSEFAALDMTVQENVAAASAVMQGVQDVTRQAMLKEAHDNMTYAESDESGGFHNHKYLMALLQDANQKALEILKPGK